MVSFALVVQATVRAAAKRLWACGQRKRVAHMPTATTTDAETYQCWISKQAITSRTHTRKTRQTTHRFRRGGRGTCTSCSLPVSRRIYQRPE
jgi:hypothetical protein